MGTFQIDVHVFTTAGFVTQNYPAVIPKIGSQVPVICMVTPTPPPPWVMSHYVIYCNLSTVILCQECTQPLSLYRSLKWWNMVPIGVKWFLTRSGPCATAHLEAGGFIRSREGIPHPNIQYHFLPSAFKDHGRVTIERDAFQVSARI